MLTAQSMLFHFFRLAFDLAQESVLSTDIVYNVR